MLRLFLFLGIVTAALASETLDAVVTAAQSFVAAMDHQITVVRSEPSPAYLAESTIAYAAAKIFYYNAFRAAMPEITSFVTGGQPWPPQAAKFGDVFDPGGEIRKRAAEDETAALLQRYSGLPAVQKAAAEFDQAKKIEEQFLKEFEGQD
jgi:hypothetical protein